MHPADVVEVIVRRHGHDRTALDERIELGTEIPDPVPGVHDEVTVAAADMPDVRLEEEIEVILDEQRDRIGHPLRPEPPLGDGQIRHVRSVKKIDVGAGRRQCTDVIDAL